MDHLKLTVDKLSVETISDLVVDDSCGAVSVFIGTTRDNFEGKKVIIFFFVKFVNFLDNVVYFTTSFM